GHDGTRLSWGEGAGRMNDEAPKGFSAAVAPGNVDHAVEAMPMGGADAVHSAGSSARGSPYASGYETGDGDDELEAEDRRYPRAGVGGGHDNDMGDDGGAHVRTRKRRATRVRRRAGAGHTAGASGVLSNAPSSTDRATIQI